MDSGRETDQFDDLFEPFELDEGPVDAGAPEAVAPKAEREPEPPPPAASVNCPSCGSSNPAHNRHCEQCGARLGKGPLPVAPPPMVRTTPGGRALSVLAVVVGIVALITIFFNLRGDSDPEDGATQTTVTSTTVTSPVDELVPTSVDASSFFPGFPPDNLIDSDPETYWNDNSQRGLEATITFRFAQPVQIRDIEFQNLTDDTKFKRNYRIKDYVIKVDDLAIEIASNLRDVNEPQTQQIASLATRTLTIEVRSTYPAQAVGDDPPFSELALQSIRFFGATAG